MNMEFKTCEECTKVKATGTKTKTTGVKRKTDSTKNMGTKTTSTKTKVNEINSKLENIEKLRLVLAEHLYIVWSGCGVLANHSKAAKPFGLTTTKVVQQEKLFNAGINQRIELGNQTNNSHFDAVWIIYCFLIAFLHFCAVLRKRFPFVVFVSC